MRSVSAERGRDLIEASATQGFDLVLFLEIALRCHRISTETTRNPLSPDEVYWIGRMREMLVEAEKKTLRACWDGEVFCRYRDAACVFSISEIQIDADREQILDCKWRGKKVPV